MRLFRSGQRTLTLLPIALTAVLAGATGTLLGDCGPFTDVSDPSFCPFIIEILYLGVTSGASATTYNPVGDVTRVQMAKFLAISVDSALKRGSRRAALGQFWKLQTTTFFDVTTVGIAGSAAGQPASDGLDVWVP